MEEMRRMSGGGAMQALRCVSSPSSRVRKPSWYWCIDAVEKKESIGNGEKS